MPFRIGNRYSSVEVDAKHLYPWFKKTPDGFFKHIVGGEVLYLGTELPLEFRASLQSQTPTPIPVEVCKTCKGTKEIQLMRTVVSCTDCK